MARDTLPAWNLGTLYTGVNDKKINGTMRQAENALKVFSKKYRGKVAKTAGSAASLKAAFAHYEKILVDVAKPAVYAQLLFAESCSDPRRGAFMQGMRGWHAGMEKQLFFFEIELLTLSAAKLEKLARDKTLKNYANYLRQLARSKPHRLSEREEQILSDKALTGREAFTRLFDQELSQKEFEVKAGRVTKKLCESDVLAMLYSPKRDVRKQGAEALTAGLKAEAPRLGFIYNTLIEDKTSEDVLRGFSYPEQGRHLANQIEREMVDAMSAVVVDNYGLVQDFYRYKRGLLRLPVLHDYDRYAPVVKSEKVLSFKESERLVLEAFSRFSPEYARIAKEFFAKRWVDAAKRPGKRGGAFCSFVTPDRNPFVFMNFNGNLRDVSTLAHELGHAIHAYLMRQQSYLNFDVPLTVAETASVFAEMLLFDHLSSTLTSKSELLSLYVNKVESIFATVFRQISLYRFEQEVHRARAKKGELLVTEINRIWRKSQEEMFKSSVQLTEGYDWWWSYIPHFIHTPFYVYAYAYGELLTLSLYAQYKKDGSDFVGRYMEALSTGNLKDPTGLLAPFGIDMSSRRFWENGIGLIAELVERTRRLA